MATREGGGTDASLSCPQRRSRWIGIELRQHHINLVHLCLTDGDLGLYTPTRTWPQPMIWNVLLPGFIPVDHHAYGKSSCLKHSSSCIILILYR
jgi:hypothetical protein